MIRWWRQRLIRKALPTLKAMAHDGGVYFGRSLYRLWLDGGSVAGFHACRRLGWADYRRFANSRLIRTLDDEPIVFITAEGRREIQRQLARGWNDERADCSDGGADAGAPHGKAFPGQIASVVPPSQGRARESRLS